VRGGAGSNASGKAAIVETLCKPLMSVAQVRRERFALISLAHRESGDRCIRPTRGTSAQSITQLSHVSNRASIFRK
jgi:hypothetical protein